MWNKLLQNFVIRNNYFISLFWGSGIWAKLCWTILLQWCSLWSLTGIQLMADLIWTVQDALIDMSGTLAGSTVKLHSVMTLHLHVVFRTLGDRSWDFSLSDSLFKRTSWKLPVLLKARGRKNIASLCFVCCALLVKGDMGQPRFKGVERIEPPLWMLKNLWPGLPRQFSG